MLNRRCSGDHQHDPVIGGNRITRPAGHRALARSWVSALENQFNFETKRTKRREPQVRQALAAEAGDPEAVEEPVEVVQSDGESEDELIVDKSNIKIPAAVRQAVHKLHVNTGHRSVKRLARALVICGAPTEAVIAAKQLDCSVCKERRQPRVRPAATLPVPRDTGDQVHVDLVKVNGIHDNTSGL